MLIQVLSFTLGSILMLFGISLLKASSNSNPNNINQNRNTRFSQQQLPICVVGGGISGLNIASLLQEKGYPVELFEKKQVLGGKLVTFRVPGEIQVDMCPLLFSSRSDSLIKKLNQFQLTPLPFIETDRAEFNPRTGQVYSPANLTSFQHRRLMDAASRYVSYRDSYENNIGYGYLNSSSELFVPASEWLRTRNLQPLLPIFTLLITAQGYGHLDDISALYALKYVDSDMMVGLASNKPGVFYTVSEGLDVLVSRMASNLKVFLNKEVINIDRQGENKILTFNTYERKSCRSVILAFPPLLPTLQRIIPDLSANERNVLDQVRIHKYVSAANSIPSLETNLYSEQPPIEGIGEVTTFVKQSSLKRKNIYSSYSWIRGDYNSTATPNELLRINRQLATALRRMSRNPETFLINSSEHFPHVDINALKEGFYKGFNAIQGIRQVYYATTLLDFEVMDGALKMTEEFVRRYF